MTAARFLSLEGGEGAGKSTQARALARALESRGARVLVTREPGGSEGAEAIRTLLMQGEAGRWSARSEALLFAAARADHVEKVIRPAIADGRWVVCDRYVDSTRAYQGAAGGVADGDVRMLHAFGSDGLLPDRTYYLALPPEEGAARAAARDGGDDRFARRDSAFHATVATAFDRIAAGEPDRVRRIDAGRAADAVTQAILDDLGDWLP